MDSRHKMGGNRGDIALYLTHIFRTRSLNDIAAQAGLSHTMVSRVEKRERMPTIDTLLRMAAALEIDLGKFLARALKD
jgi:transcriptional regulator with XRE-family HTH domain